MANPWDHTIKPLVAKIADGLDDKELAQFVEILDAEYSHLYDAVCELAKSRIPEIFAVEDE